MMLPNRLIASPPLQVPHTSTLTFSLVSSGYWGKGCPQGHAEGPQRHSVPQVPWQPNSATWAQRESQSDRTGGQTSPSPSVQHWTPQIPRLLQQGSLITKLEHLQNLQNFTFQEWLYEKSGEGFSKVSTYIKKRQAGWGTAEFNIHGYFHKKYAVPKLQLATARICRRFWRQTKCFE